MSKKVPWARAAFSVLLAMYVLFMLHPILAKAQEGSVRVSQEFNEDASYDAYQVFASCINAEGVATDIAWASEGVRQVVLGYADEHGYPTWLEQEHAGDGQHDLAQNVAEFIASMANGVEADVPLDGEAPASQSSSFMMGLAQALAASELEPSVTVRAGEELVGEQGYWLLVTNMASIASPDEAGTAPLWLVVGPTQVDVVEKASIPSANFVVQEDSTQAWQKVADGNRGQALRYRVEGTLPANFDEFSQYHYRFEICLPQEVHLALAEDESLAKALSLTVGDNAVQIDGTNVTASYEQSTLVVDFPDLRSDFWREMGLDSESTITVEYGAYLTEGAGVGMPGHDTVARLVYTADPVSLAESTTQDMSVTVFTYQIEVLKADSQTGTLVSGAAFSLRVHEDDDSEKSELYVQKDGSLGTEAYSFATDEHGKVTIAGLDEGHYTLVEERAPDGYQKLASGIDITIRTHLSPLDRTIEDFTVSKDADAPCEVLSIKPEQGSASLQVANTRVTEEEPPKPGIERMPQTGVGPTAELLIAIGLAVTGISLVRARRQRF